MTTLTIDDRGIRVACPDCGRTNRIPFARVGDRGSCGGCGVALPAPGAPLAVESEPAFAALIGSAPVRVLVDFWAAWCAPCRAVAPELEKVAASAGGSLLVAKVNTEELPGLAQRFGIQSIPTMALFADGAEIARVSGSMPARDIEAFARS